MTSNIEELKNWLLQEGCTHIAMESTGKYWIPIYNILEDSFELTLANASHVKNVPGRKTDTNDSRWIAKLLALGLIEGSFVPPKDIRELRELTRYRQKLVQMRSSERNRIQGILETCNIKLSCVVSDIFGVSGMAMLNALISDEDKEISEIADLAKRKLRRKIPEIMEALNGFMDKHHSKILRLILEHLAYLDEQIEEVENMIDEQCQPYQEVVNILETIPGVDKVASQSIIAEIGTNMSVFHSQDHLASWCGLSPGNNESAGKKKRTKVMPGNNYIKTVLCQCAHAASNSKDTYLATRYWSIKARRGPQKATIATARKIIISIYHIIKNREFYHESGHEAYMNARDKNRVRSLKKKLESLGFDVVKKAEVV